MKPIHPRFRSMLFVAAMCGCGLPAAIADAPPTPVPGLTLPRCIGPNMVLQRDARVTIWGAARPGSVVPVRFRDQATQATAAPDGRWTVTLDALTPSAPGRPDTLRIGHLSLDNVLVGDVWLGSGQSNMAMVTREYVALDPALADAAGRTYPRIRLLAADGWREANPTAIAEFSALLFSFGVALGEQVDAPIGLMTGAVSGTPSSRWLAPQMLLDDPACRAILAQRGGGDPDAALPPHVGDLYRSYIHPLAPTALRGVLWDQGESGVGLDGIDQLRLMGALVAGWRLAMNQPDLPFLYMQKHSGGGCAFDPDSPLNAQSVPFAPLPRLPPTTAEGVFPELSARMIEHRLVRLVATSDLGPGGHPPLKSSYGRRAAQVALAEVYARPIVAAGPRYAEHRIDADAVTVRFTHLGSGLAFRHADRIQGFALAGEDRVFHWADARIDGDRVVVRCPQVPRPVAVRYAWGPIAPWANLFNREGLPALMFRTDRWP